MTNHENKEDNLALCRGCLDLNLHYHNCMVISSCHSKFAINNSEGYVLLKDRTIDAFGNNDNNKNVNQRRRKIKQSKNKQTNKQLLLYYG